MQLVASHRCGTDGGHPVQVPLGHHGDHTLAAQAVGQQGAAAGWPGR